MEKQCRMCGEMKDLSAYYIHAQMKDGHLNICKKCTKDRIRNDRANNPEKLRRRDAEKYQANLEANRAKRREYSRNTAEERREYKRQWARKQPDPSMSSRKFRLEYPEKYAAHVAVGNAIKYGALVRLPCEVCGDKAEAHHDDYEKPLDVRWLCRKHHMELHRKYPIAA